MPPADRIEVVPAELVAHAGHLDRIADAVTLARQAGATTRLDADAYGQLCTTVPVLLGQVQRILLDGVGAAAGAVGDAADRLRTAADRYRATDARSQAALDRVRQRS
ncbi:type VII secretion target [Micromonospora mangrovi]|uniref:Type VII secretion target n=2 Tax=Micromonospora TaxID=1873 RepID=A0AAU8HHJ5_9ACTN